MGGLVLGAIWAVAAVGVVLKAVFLNRFAVLSTVVYAVMGWAGVFMIGELRGSLPLAGIAWLLGGGLAYTVGIAFYAARRLRYAHMIWHLWCLAGAGCHFVAILRYL
jgi:hemolysin III